MNFITLRILLSFITFNYIILLSTVKPFAHSLLNDRDPFSFDKGDWTKGINGLCILIYLLILIFKLEYIFSHNS